MREINFRAWDGNRKEMIPSPRWQAANNSVGTTLMQFTGHKDKNEVEIYEGDILTCEYPQPPDPIPPKVLVSWSDEWNGWNFKPDLITAHCFYVIGNIYENPELMGGG